MAARTITIDTGEMTYVDRHGEASAVVNGQTFKWNYTDIGTGAVYTGAADSSDILLSNGKTIVLESDPKWSWFTVTANATAEVNAGYLTFLEDGFVRNQWKVRTATLADADGTGASNITTMTLERVDNPMVTMVLETVTMA